LLGAQALLPISASQKLLAAETLLQGASRSPKPLFTKNYETMTKHGNFSFERLADFLNEVGMLKATPRSGFAFLGSGHENVAEHSYRASVIGFVLANLADADVARVVFLCLFHDLHEARTGDFNYVNHRYDSCKARQALEDAARGTGLEQMIAGYFDEFCARESLEAKLARDADQLDLLCNLRMELARGNEFARTWIDSALQRLKTIQAKKLAQAILQADPNRWWHENVDKDWWINHGEQS
jgi:Predicted hydrolases of HD superfamily